MPDFIYTLDSEPESDVELEEAPLDELDTSKTAGPSTTTAHSLSTKKKATKPSKSTTKSSKPATEASRAKDIDEDDAAAPTIDPTFNFDLGGGGGSFFDGLGVDELGIDADEVRAGTNPVCLAT